MSPEVKTVFEPFFRTVALASRSALLLDYDGTLAPFHIQRDQAFPYPGVSALLQEIIRNGRTRVVLISGRDVADLVPLLNLQPVPEIWGSHGLQRRGVDGTIKMPRLNDLTLTSLSDAENWLSYQQLRDAAEFKTGGIAVHWRGLDELTMEDIRSRVLLGWRIIAARGGLELLDFDGGIEIHAREANKGQAVRDFLHQEGPDVPVAYLGDDTTDESAFHAMGERGVTVLVRPKWRRSSARLWLQPPDEIVEFLDMWLRSGIRGRAAQVATR